MRFDKKAWSASAAYIMGLSPEYKINGTPNDVRVFSGVLESSRKLYVVLHECESIDLLSEALADKKEKAKSFNDTFGQPWPF